MKKKILEALQAQFEGVEARILDRIAGKLAKTITDEAGITDAVKAVTIQQVLESYGDYRATESSETAVSNYEKKHNLKDGKSIKGPQAADPTNEQPPMPEDTPTWAKALLEQNKALTDRLNSLEGARMAESRKAQLQTITKNLPESVRKAYDRMDIQGLKDDEFQSLIGEVTSEVEGISKDLGAKKSLFGIPPGGAGSGEEKVPQSVQDGIKGLSQEYKAEGQPF